MTLSQILYSQTVEKGESFRKKEIERLIEPIIEYMVSYLLEGFVNSNITQGFDISGAKALNFHTALKIRFLLDGEVKDFLKMLETYLRRIRTEVSREKDLRKGEVRGHIDWRRTIQTWASSGFKDKTVLAISKPVRNYDIPENLILKKIVSLLNNLMNDKEVRREIERDYEWSNELRERRRYVQGVLRNVYFKRIMNERKIQITSRMKSQVRRSRKQLYRDSCKIFEKYQSVFFKHELGQLLKDTFIDPNNLDKTYEIFCLFTVIKTLDQLMGWEIKKLKEITRQRNETAVLTKGNFIINIFYNVTGGLEFYSRKEPEQTKKALEKITKAYFGKERRLTTRRPDIIVELLCGETYKDYIVLEVKYTENDEYIVEGIYQALHYLYDLTREGKKRQFFWGKTLLGKGYNGAVIAYKLPEVVRERKAVTLENKKLKIKLFEFSDLKQYDTLKRFFEKSLEPYGLV